MSAWIVSKKHIDLMVVGIIEGTRDGLLKGVKKNPDKLGQMLVDQCVRSVSYRYPGSNVLKSEFPGSSDPYYLKPYKFEHPGYVPTAGELLKAISCYRYQSCEDPGWDESEACRTTALLETKLKKFVPKKMGQRWLEYDESPWGFDETEIALCYAKADDTGRELIREVKEIGVGRLSDWLMEKGLLNRPLDDNYFLQYFGRQLGSLWGTGT